MVTTVSSRDFARDLAAGQVLPFTAEVALVCAPLHVPDPRRFRDSMIAATAMQPGFALVTRNVDDFKGLALKVVNPWDA